MIYINMEDVMMDNKSLGDLLVSNSLANEA